jgi:hypothetical protein
VSRGVALVALLCGALCACVAPTPPPARVSVALLSGRPASPPAGPARVAVVVDAGEDMAELTSGGASYWTGARRAAERLIGSLPTHTRADLLLAGGTAEAGCLSPPEPLADDAAVATRLAEATPAGRAALAATLERLAERAGEGDGPSRAVVFTRLSQSCGGDLCAAAQRLAARDVRLDLVVIGDAQPPACLAELSQREWASPPAGWAAATPVPFHVSSPSLEPGLRLCTDAGGHALPVPPGRATLVVRLEPPLRLERSFAPGSRWQLQVLDFPALDPPVREWVWRELPPEPESGSEPRVGRRR